MPRIFLSMQKVLTLVLALVLAFVVNPFSMCIVSSGYLFFYISLMALYIFAGLLVNCSRFSIFFSICFAFSSSNFF